MLQPLLSSAAPVPPRPPIGALVKSLISGRTQDAVSLAAYDRLCRRYPTPAALAQAAPAAVAHVVAYVTFAEAKAGWLAQSMALIGHECPTYDLDFLGTLPLDAAIGWLERLPGVARKVAAATLNGSRLRRPIFIVDSHILRVLQRLHFVGPHADYRIASEQVTAGAPAWTGEQFLEFHRTTKRLGQLICRPESPQCGRCPLVADCPSARRHRVH